MATKTAQGWDLGLGDSLTAWTTQIIDLRSSGLSWARVAETLNAMEVPRALTGRQWYPSTARNAALACERDMERTTARSD